MEYIVINVETLFIVEQDTTIEFANVGKKNYSGVAIDGGQSDYFKVSQGSDAMIRFLKIEIDKSEEDLIKD